MECTDLKIGLDTMIEIKSSFEYYVPDSLPLSLGGKVWAWSDPENVRDNAQLRGCVL